MKTITVNSISEFYLNDNLSNDRIVLDMEYNEEFENFINVYLNINKKSVLIMCYGRYEIWRDKKKALKFYREGASSCDGSEKERYTNIVLYLLDGERVAYDY